jgi:hypothetical protein
MLENSHNIKDDFVMSENNFTRNQTEEHPDRFDNKKEIEYNI